MYEKRKPLILICDDDPTIRSSLELVLGRAGYETAPAATSAAAVDFVRGGCPDLILMDMNYTKSTSGEEGLELLAKVRVFRPEVPVILITAWGSISLAVKGIRAGAFDFVTKPWNNLALLNIIETALQVNAAAEEPYPESAPAGKTLRRGNIIGNSPLLLKVLDTVSRIAATNAPVLITGESGTGKELIAEAIHHNSNRSKGPFVKVNLGGISQSLFESEMFGHKKGAFTDARQDRAGRFELADKGSIFLDEIGELDTASQVKLLRVLQDQTFESLGDSLQKRADVRVISATNRNLADMVAKGTFREDLFYRINLIAVHVPSLRERAEDIPLLTNHFARKQAELSGTRPAEISAGAIEFLRKLPWPGNIREMKNLVDRTILVSGKQTITEQDFKEQYTEPPAGIPQGGEPVGQIDEVERAMVLRAMETYGGNHSKVAAALGLSRQALYRRMEKYGIK